MGSSPHFLPAALNNTTLSKSPMYDLTAMDLVRAALHNAEASGLDLYDIIRAAEHALAPEDFDRAVNVLGETEPHRRQYVQR